MSTIAKITEGIYIKDFVVKRKWIYAKLVINIPDAQYLSEWTYDGIGIQERFKDKEDDMIVVIPIKRHMQNWDAAFWKGIRDKNVDAEKVWKEFSKIVPQRRIDKKETQNILNKSW